MKLIASHETAPEDALVLANTDDVLAQREAIAAAPRVLLQFPKWTDGRAYSQAVLLRSRLRFAGEIRATGDVVVDMLPLLRRCGFSEVQLREGQNAETAQRMLDSLPGPFPGHYQGDAIGNRPVFAALAS